MRLRLLAFLCLLSVVTAILSGACCTGTSACSIETDPECDILDGLYLGDSSTCSGSPCATFSSCCLPSGECGILPPQNCTGEGGLVQDEFDNTTGFCSNNINCSATVGCCEEGAETACLDINPAACLAMERTITGLSCQENPCIGACCIGGGCVIVLRAECGPPADYQGHLTSCSDHCQNEPGACCFEEASCTDVSTDNCFIADGMFQGRGTICANTTCPEPAPTPTPAPPVEPQDRTPYIIGITVSIGVIFCCACFIIFYCNRERRR